MEYIIPFLLVYSYESPFLTNLFDASKSLASFSKLLVHLPAKANLIFVPDSRQMTLVKNSRTGTK
jgi:hypothetical protein